jgi:hypothetical protein
MPTWFSVYRLTCGGQRFGGHHRLSENKRFPTGAIQPIGQKRHLAAAKFDATKPAFQAASSQSGLDQCAR